MAFTYTTLKQAIQDYTENSDTDFTTDNLDIIIDLTELRILREVDLTIARKESLATASVATSAEVTTSLPSDIVVIRYVKVTSGPMLLPKDESFVLEFNAGADDETNPKFYSWSVAGDQLRVAPGPSSAITLDIGYTYRITGLSDSNTTSWLGTNAPDALLYGCMLESQAFMKEEQQEAQRWQNLYNRAMETLGNEEEKRRRTDEYRDTEKR